MKTVVGYRYGRPVYNFNPIIKTKQSSIKTKINNITLNISNDEIINGTIQEDTEYFEGNFLQITESTFIELIELSNQSANIITLVLLMHLIKHNAHSKDYIFANYNEFAEASGQLKVKVPSKSTISRGLNSLFERNTIANHYKGVGWYWFDPEKMFIGTKKWVYSK